MRSLATTRGWFGGHRDQCPLQVIRNNRVCFNQAQLGYTAGDLERPFQDTIVPDRIQIISLKPLRPHSLAHAAQDLDDPLVADVDNELAGVRITTTLLLIVRNGTPALEKPSQRMIFLDRFSEMELPS